MNPNGQFFKYWSAAMMPAILYAAVVTPFEIAFVSESCDLLAPNLVPHGPRHWSLGLLRLARGPLEPR